MTYDVAETSQHEGSPVEGYDFAYGATHFRWTSSDVAQEFESETYVPAVISRSEISQSQEDHAGNIEITVPRDNELAALFIPYIPSTPIGITIHRRHRLDGDEESVVAFVGKVLSVRFESNPSTAVITCGPISEVFRRVIPIVLYQPQCNYAVFSPGCTLNAEDFKVTATVTLVSGENVSSDEFVSTSFEDGHFNNGWMQKQSDPADKRWIVNHIGDTVTLMNPFTDLAVTDVVEVFPGCQRTEAACLAYGNLDNHLGFARIPRRNPFESSVEF